MGNHLGISFRLEAHTRSRELLTQRAVIFNDPVLNHGDPAASVTMGVGVVLLWLSVRSPAGMTNPAKPRSPLSLHTRGEVLQLSFGTDAVQFRVLQCGNARGVIAAVFQLPKSFQQERGRISRTNHRNDAAHIKKPGLAGLILWV